jgi:two-component system, OmpR family, sensor kinase ParS
MGKLFLKLWILLLLTSYTSYSIQSYILELAQREQIKNERFRVPILTSAAETIAWALRDAPVAEWPARLAENGPKFSFQTELVPAETLMDRYGVDAKKFPVMQTGKNILTLARDKKNMLGLSPVPQTDLVMVMTLPPEWPPLKIFGVMSSTTFIWLTESVLYASAVLLWLSLFWRDLAKLIRAADKIGDEDFRFKSELRPGSALRPLASSLTRMTDRIASLVNSHKALTNAISHEFRTPLTRLRFRHELAISAATAAEKDHELEQMNSAIDQLDELSSELLEYAKLDRERPKLDVAPIDTAAWLSELAEDARDVARVSGRQIEVQANSAVESIQGDYRYLSRAAANLLRNGVRYAKSRVDVQVESIDGAIVLHVDDDGPGIPESEREHLFEPFTRLDASRDRRSGGFGMGLAIVKQIARWHGGRAEISESRLGGARVSIIW